MPLPERIFITGISGFLGGFMGEYFAGRGIVVAGSSRREAPTFGGIRTIRTGYEPDEIARIVKSFKPDLIIHAAGASSVGASLEDPSEDFSKSVTLLERLLEGVRLSGIRPLMFFPSSAAVYGDPERIPTPENTALKPISPYGYHKSACETLLEEYSRVFDIPALVARLFSVFGPRQKRLLIWELFDQFTGRQEVVLEGTGNETRDYIYAADLVCLIERLLSRTEDRFLIVNVATGRALTVREVAFHMKELLNSEKPIVFKGKVRPGDPPRWHADISRYEALTEARVETDFSSRLQDCLRTWMRAM